MCGVTAGKVGDVASETLWREWTILAGVVVLMVLARLVHAVGRDVAWAVLIIVVVYAAHGVGAIAWRAYRKGR